MLKTVKKIRLLIQYPASSLSKPDIEYALVPIEEEWYRLGLGDGLADVYGKKSGFSHTGYAEMVYEDFAQETNINTPSGRSSELNVAGGVVFLGYRMNERLVINLGNSLGP